MNRNLIFNRRILILLIAVAVPIARLLAEQDALEALRKRAESGHAHSQSRLGYAYAFGQGVAKDPAQALTWLRAAAAQNEPYGQMLIGTMYANGEGVPKDLAESAKYYRLSAESGYARGQYFLARAYARGDGVPHDLNEALKWQRKAADQGDPFAYFELGNMYAQGLGVEKNMAEAARFYRCSVLVGDRRIVAPQYQLGLMYARGSGVPKDSTEAVRWLRTAAIRGYRPAQLTLGSMYAIGDGIPKNEIEGLAWLNVAASSGEAIAKRKLQEQTSKMDEEVVQRGKLRSQDLIVDIEHERNYSLTRISQSQNGRLPDWRWAINHYISAGEMGKTLMVLRNTRQYLLDHNQAASYDYAQVLYELGSVYRRLGSGLLANQALTEAVDVLSDTEDEGTKALRLKIRNMQVLTLRTMRRYPEAEAVARSVVQSLEQAQDRDNANFGYALRNLGYVMQDLRRMEEWGKYAKADLAIQRKAWGEAGSPVSIAYKNYGLYCLQTGNLAEAAPALKIGCEGIISSKGRGSEEARFAYGDMVKLHIAEGKTSEALAEADKYFESELNVIQNTFPHLEEAERLGFKSRLEPMRWYAILGATSRIAEGILQTKAVTLDQLLVAPRAREDAQDIFAHLLVPESAELGLRTFNAEEIKQRLDQAGLKRKAPGQQKSETAFGQRKLYAITSTQVCGALPKDSTVVEFLYYNGFHGAPNQDTRSMRYGALLFSSGGTRWVPLANDAAIINRAVETLLGSVGDSMSSASLGRLLRELNDLVWSDVERALPPGTKNIFICPDGQLSFLPFAGLIDPQGIFLADKFLVMHMSTARDLFRPDLADYIERADFAVFAAPSFGDSLIASSTAKGAQFREAEVRSFEQLKLVDLPGARAEAETLSSLAKARRIEAVVYLGLEANKANVRSLDKPRIVHFATHGFFLPPAPDGLLSDPMERSGLALAGAQASIDAIAKGQALPRSDRDGLLTARDVAQLTLKGTWLATLSACRTGHGEAHDGESVFGLRRGFLAAGVQNLMISLWNISDHETVAFMRDFYSRALESADPATALALTQREWLGRIRKEKGIAAAVTTAGAFVLNTSGRLPHPAAMVGTK